MTVLSSRAELVTGGDALVRIALASNVAQRNVRIALNGVDVTAVFLADEARSGDSMLTGLLSGLRLGVNTLTIAHVRNPHDLA